MAFDPGSTRGWTMPFGSDGAPRASTPKSVEEQKLDVPTLYFRQEAAFSWMRGKTRGDGPPQSPADEVVDHLDVDTMTGHAPVFLIQGVERFQSAPDCRNWSPVAVQPRYGHYASDEGRRQKERAPWCSHQRAMYHIDVTVTSGVYSEISRLRIEQLLRRLVAHSA